MLSASYSRTISQIEAEPKKWPATTKPWISATLLIGDGTCEAFLTTYESDSPMEFVTELFDRKCLLTQVLCAYPENGRWRFRHVEELLFGKLGQATVIVLRDVEGVEFCPESPESPIEHVSDLTSIRSVRRSRVDGLPHQQRNRHDGQ